jgi:hypothetical protein
LGGLLGRLSRLLRCLLSRVDLGLCLSPVALLDKGIGLLAYIESLLLA